MAFQSEHNFNIQNKLIRIDGEYVKLYVTTNNTLPKLLKNTGSLIVYHEGIEQNKKNNTPINYLYLANNLIASGWGFHTKTERDDAEFFFNYGNDYNNSHIGEHDTQFNHNYYNIVNKLYDTLSFWNTISANNGLLDDTFKLKRNDVISQYKLYFNEERESKQYPTFLSLYKDSNVFSSINDIIHRVCYFNEKKYEQYVPFNKNLTNTPAYAPFAMQYLNKELIGTQTDNSSIIYHYDNEISQRKVFLDMIPYMLGPAIYIKPQIIDFDVQLYYQYKSHDLGTVLNNNDNVTTRFIAKKVNGKYQIPKGANIEKIVMKLIVKMNDAKSLFNMSYDYAISHYNNHLYNISLNDETEQFTSFISSSLLLNYTKNEYTEILNTTIDNEFKSFSTKYNRASIDLYNTAHTKYGDNYEEYTIEFHYADNLSVIFEDTTLIRNIVLGYSGIKEYKLYTGFTNPFFDNPTITETNETGDIVGAAALNCILDKTNNLLIDHNGQTYNTLYSFEYAWTKEYIDISQTIDIEAIDVAFVSLLPKDFKYTLAISNEKYSNGFSLVYKPTNDNLQSPTDVSFDVNDLFGHYYNISPITDNHSLKVLHNPISIFDNNKSVNIEEYKQGFDLLTLGIPKDKSIKAVYANIEYTNKIVNSSKYKKLIQKENITGLLKIVSHRNYFISLNPEMTSVLSAGSTIQRSSCVTETKTNMFAQPYVVYFALLPRTYIRENQNNVIISFDIEFDNEPNYNTSSPFDRYGYDQVDNIFGKSLNKNILASNTLINDTTVNIIRIATILSEQNNAEMISDTDYDSSHIFNLSQNLLTPFEKYKIQDNIDKQSWPTFISGYFASKQTNPIMMFTQATTEEIVKKYCDKLNYLSM